MGLAGCGTLCPEGAHAAVEPHRLWDTNTFMTADDRYATNMTLLRHALPAMADQIPQVPLTNVMMMPGENGELIGHAWEVTTQQWVPLCSSHTPTDDAAKEVEAFWQEEPRVYCLVGYGLGHFAVAFAQKLLPWQRLAIFELAPSLFKASLYAVDLLPLIGQGKRIDLYVGDALDQSLENFFLSLGIDEKMAIATPMRGGHTNAHMAKEYDRISLRIVDFLRHHAVGLATWEQFGPAIGRNDVANTPEYLSLPGLEQLKEAWQGKPAVCIAAGPSLHKNLLQLMDATVRPHLAVLTVGTCYALLHGLGLKPDLVTTIDFQELNYTDQFQHVPLDPACPLVYLHSTYPETIRRWPGPMFVTSNDSDFVRWVKEYAEPKYQAALVQTVAHLNVLAAIEMGCDPIILLGQDLAMPPDIHHAAGARAQDTAPDDAKDSFVEVKDYAGNPTYTRHSFLTMQETFARIKRLYPHANIINCSEGGLAIEGIPNQPLRAVLDAIRQAEMPAPMVPLRHIALTTARAYKPQTRWGDVLRDVEGLLAEGAACRQWVEEVEHSWKGYEATEAREHITTIMEHQNFIREHQALYSLMAVKRYDFMQAMSVAPAAALVNDAPAIEVFNAKRIVRTAQLIREELPNVLPMIAAMARRLEDAASYYDERQPFASWREIVTLMARQSWQVVRQRLRLGWPEDVSPALAARILLQLAWHTQQYEDVVQLTESIPHPQKRALALQVLHAFNMSSMTAAPQYRQQSPQPVQPPADSGDWI